MTTAPRNFVMPVLSFLFLWISGAYATPAAIATALDYPSIRILEPVGMDPKVSHTFVVRGTVSVPMGSTVEKFTLYLDGGTPTAKTFSITIPSSGSNKFVSPPIRTDDLEDGVHNVSILLTDSRGQQPSKELIVVVDNHWMDDFKGSLYSPWNFPGLWILGIITLSVIMIMLTLAVVLSKRR